MLPISMRARMRSVLVTTATAAACLCLPAPGLANSPDRAGAVVDNGVVQLGINDWGNLNFWQDGNETSDCTRSCTDVVGLRFLRADRPALESTADGCTCEGWGIADAGTGLSGWANDSSGYAGLELVSFTHDATSATSVMRTQGFVGGGGGGDDGAGFAAPASFAGGEPAPQLQVTQEYRPAAGSSYLYEDVVTVENIGDAPATDLRYRRVMDWDIEPTPFDEFSTIDGTDSSALLFSSDNGFDTADPLGYRDWYDLPQCTFATGGSDHACVGFFTDAGPEDHGAHFDFGFGGLAPGESKRFIVYYGAAPDEASAVGAVSAVGGEVWSFGQANVEHGPDLGAPATFVFAFATSRAVDTSGPAPSMTLSGPSVVDLGDDDAPAPIDLTARLHNFGGLAADDLEVMLDGAGLTVDAPNPVGLGSLAPGADARAGFRLTAPPTCRDATYRVTAHARWAGDTRGLNVVKPIIVHGTCGRVYGVLSGFDRGGHRALRFATVDLCLEDLTGCESTTTSGSGRYEFDGVAPGTYRVVAHAGGGFTDPPTQTSDPIAIGTGDDVNRDFAWENIDVVDEGTTLSGEGLVGSGPVPTLYWSAPTTLRRRACPDGTVASSARFRLVDASGAPWNDLPGADADGWIAFTQKPDGSFEAAIPPVYPHHGDAHVDIEVTCDGAPSLSGFDVYIDPSGVIYDTTGSPLPGATVILYRYEGPTLGYRQVADGSAVMSPANRTNPDLTDAVGHFGWDVIAGNYVVRAQKAGCHAPGAPSVPYVETATMTIPPPVTDIVLTLDCTVPETGGGGPATGGGQAQGSSSSSSGSGTGAAAAIVSGTAPPSTKGKARPRVRLAGSRRRIAKTRFQRITMLWSLVRPDRAMRVKLLVRDARSRQATTAAGRLARRCGPGRGARGTAADRRPRPSDRRDGAPRAQPIAAQGA